MRQLHCPVAISRANGAGVGDLNVLIVDFKVWNFQVSFNPCRLLQRAGESNVQVDLATEVRVVGKISVQDWVEREGFGVKRDVRWVICFQIHGAVRLHCGIRDSRAQIKISTMLRQLQLSFDSGHRAAACRQLRNIERRL